MELMMATLCSPVATSTVISLFSNHSSAWFTFHALLSYACSRTDQRIGSENLRRHSGVYRRRQSSFYTTKNKSIHRGGYMKRFFIALLLAATLASPLPLSHAQKRKESVATPASQAKQHGVDLITADQIRNYLYFIASDQMEGRDTPSRGLDTTAQFLVSNLSRWGFKPAGDDGTYFQHIGLRTERPD